MQTSKEKKSRLIGILLGTILLFSLYGFQGNDVSAQNINSGGSDTQPGSSNTTIEVINPYFSIEHRVTSDGVDISGYIINGPFEPPAEYKTERITSIKPTTSATILPNFPSYDWVFGCSAVSGSMIAAYFDRGAYPNIYTGPTNGGVMPITDTSWPSWSDGYNTYVNNPLVASHNGVDGRITRGSIDDYWVKYGSTDNDPYITNGWVQHTWGTAIGDFMKTSQSASPYNNIDGQTKFYNFSYSSNKLTCSTMEGLGIEDEDGTYGRKLFYEARGYSVGACYNQSTDNIVAGGFSLANFQAEINAGNPVLLNLEGHSIVGYGYDGSTIYIRDTWDSDPIHTYTMPWGGVYQNMELLSVSVVHLNTPGQRKPVFLPLVSRTIPPNQRPTNILLSNNMIQENLPINSVVGIFTSIDPNPGDTFSYSLVHGDGDTGNVYFNISGNRLRSSAVFDYETQNNYSIRVRATDQGNLYLEKIFTIHITPESIKNPDFELGAINWEEYSTHGWDLILEVSDLMVTPYHGSWAVWLGGDYDETAYIQQQVLIPASYPYLSYWQWIASEDLCGYDFGKVLINNTMVDEYDLCSNNNTDGWVQHVVNLSAYGGTTVNLQIRAECDATLNSNLFVDLLTFEANPENLNPIADPIIDIQPDNLKQEIIGQ